MKIQDLLLKVRPRVATRLTNVKAHPNNVNQVRYHYKEILADMADSNMLDDLLSQLYGAPGTYQKLSTNLARKIRNSAYALC